MKLSDKNIIFIFSLPRSGSTLLQRLIGSHQKIHTVSETWLLLSQLHWFEDTISYADYDYETTKLALNDFISQLEGGEETYKSFISDLVCNCLASSLEKTESDHYFLEKTPRNVLVLDQIFSMFPNSKFIFLWRNPIAVASSIVETFGKGKWKVKNYEIDLFKGLNNLVEGHQKYKDRSISIKYEDLVSQPDIISKKIFDYLGLELSECGELSDTILKGALGDKVGIKEYKSISSDPIMKWRTTINNPFRKYWIKKYLYNIGLDKLRVMGYEYAELMTELDATPLTSGSIIEDVMRSLYYNMNSVMNIKYIISNIKKKVVGKKVYSVR